MDDTPSLGEGAVRDLSAVRKVELGRREGFVATAHLQSGRSQSLVNSGDIETLKRTGYLSRVMSPLIAGRGTRPRPWLLSEIRKAIAALAASEDVPLQKLVQSRPQGAL